MINPKRIYTLLDSAEFTPDFESSGTFMMKQENLELMGLTFETHLKLSVQYYTESTYNYSDKAVVEVSLEYVNDNDNASTFANFYNKDAVALIEKLVN